MIVVLISLSRSPPISRCLHFCPTSVVVLLSSLYQSSQQGSNTRIICLNSEETHRHKDTPNHSVHHQLKLRIARVPRANRFQVKWSDLRAITLLGPSPHNCPILQLSSLVYVVTPCAECFYVRPPSNIGSEGKAVHSQLLTTSHPTTPVQ